MRCILGFPYPTPHPAPPRSGLFYCQDKSLGKLRQELLAGRLPQAVPGTRAAKQRLWDHVGVSSKTLGTKSIPPALISFALSITDVYSIFSGSGDLGFHRTRHFFIFVCVCVCGCGGGGGLRGRDQAFLTSESPSTMCLIEELTIYIFGMEER